MIIYRDVIITTMNSNDEIGHKFNCLGGKSTSSIFWVSGCMLLDKFISPPPMVLIWMAYYTILFTDSKWHSCHFHTRTHKREQYI